MSEPQAAVEKEKDEALPEAPLPAKPKPAKKTYQELAHDGHTAVHEEHSEGNWLVSYADMMTLLVGFFVILISFSKFDEEKFEEARKSVTEQFGGVFSIPYEKLFEKLQEALKNLGLGEQLVIKQSDAGITIELRGTVFFDTAKADVKPEAAEILGKMVNAIKTEPVNYDITIEGHTDDVPISTSFKNNFELSSIRACRVLEIFKDAGIDPTHLIAVGYGETRPLVPNRDASGNAIVENQNQNRRVVIKIYKHPEAIMDSGSETKKD